jgi:hypothetical protein
VSFFPGKTHYTGMALRNIGDYENIGEIKTSDASQYSESREWTNISFSKDLKYYPDSIISIKTSQPGIWRTVYGKGEFKVNNDVDHGWDDLIFQGKPGSYVILEFMPRNALGFYVQTKEYVRLKVVE